MKKIMKSKKGITLISLVVTIIILLILAGISIGMLSGDNSIIGQAGNAKTQTDIAEEKEIIDLAVVHAMGKSKHGDIDETYFTNELEKNNATAIKKGSKYKVTFSSGRQYEVDQDGNVKEKKFNPNALEISELNENASTYFGWDVINYTETLDSSLDYMNWQLFYAGALDGETEERIYLISKEYVKNTDLPTVIKNGAKVEGAKPIAKSDSTYGANFSTYQSNAENINDGVLQPALYTGSLDISANMKKYNKSYFVDKKYTSTGPNMRAVAYMLDTSTWSQFSSSSKGYAEYAMGGPSVELVFTAYNKYKGLTGSSAYLAEAKSKNGYQISNDGGVNYANSITSSMIENDIMSGTIKINNPYSVSSLIGNAEGYWLSSSGNYNAERVLYLSRSGDIVAIDYNVQTKGIGFRPLILLNSNYTLEKTKDLNGNDAFKIVEQ